MGNCIGIKHTEIHTEEKKHLCSKCFLNQSSYVRKFDPNKVPQKFILNPSDISYISISLSTKNSFDKTQIVNLPKEYILTKYDYYLCTSCYALNDQITCEWNYWKLC